MYVAPATNPVTVLYSDWNVQVLIDSGALVVGAATVMYAVVLVHCPRAVPLATSTITYKSRRRRPALVRAMRPRVHLIGSVWGLIHTLVDQDA